MDASSILLYITVTLGWMFLIVSIPIWALKIIVLKTLKNRYPKDWELLSSRVFDASFRAASSLSVAGYYLEQKKITVLFSDSFVDLNSRYGHFYRFSLKAFNWLLLVGVIWMLGLVIYVEFKS